jgi:DNA polymerase-3 subunit epsilon
MSLLDLDVLFVDCQATAASPRGHLIELGWGRRRGEAIEVQARLVRLPRDLGVPPAVARVTGITTRMTDAGVGLHEAWRDLLADAAALPRQPAPAVIHFARFETPFLTALAGTAPPLDIVCTHEIARRLLPDLPRRSLRALSGYLGRGVGALRRSGEHVEATAHVWRELASRLVETDVRTWDDLRRWLDVPVRHVRPSGRVWPMPREVRLAAPTTPGVYRMLRTSGDVLYVGKAASLRDRVNSYFRQRHGGDDRMLEMLSQARALSCEPTCTALEAALLEADEIKRLRPPYNVALTGEAREIWFAPADLSRRVSHASPNATLGPFPSAVTLDRFAALLSGQRLAVAEARWGPAEDVFREGVESWRAGHPELASLALPPHERVLRVGTRLWREGRRDRDEEPEAFILTPPASSWTPERVRHALERAALQAALAVRRARWLTRFVEVSVVWTEPGAAAARLLVLEHGVPVERRDVATGTTPPVPPGCGVTTSERHAALTVATFDRVRVLMTEVKRLVAERAPVAVRVCVGPPLAGARLARVFAWL